MLNIRWQVLACSCRCLLAIVGFILLQYQLAIVRFSLLALVGFFYNNNCRFEGTIVSFILLLYGSVDFGLPL